MDSVKCRDAVLCHYAVLTWLTRPDGLVRSTPGLIRVETGRDNVENVVWGKGDLAFGGIADDVLECSWSSQLIAKASLKPFLAFGTS